MNSAEEIFVFVVCGATEHIDTLHFSINALRKFSTKKVIVVTDSTRNEIPIGHKEIIDISAPAHFSHHQASIYLKTGLFKFLPAGNLYCYLDTDVVALSEHANNIFAAYHSPITFCTDHCRIRSFSPSAMNCGCQAQFDTDNAIIAKFHTEIDKKNKPEELYINSCMAEINGLIERSKRNEFIYFFHRLQYFLSDKYYYLNGYKLEKKSGAWFDKNGKQLTRSFKSSVAEIERITGFKYMPKTGEWQRSDGTSLSYLACSHLLAGIKNKFGIDVKDNNWNHWNGGVFLFDDTSHDFLESWHEATLEIFKDPAWRTRDQGTLAATVWRFGLQEHDTLPLKFNFIADYYSNRVQYKGGLDFELNGGETFVHPHFIHIYHHWGDESWQVWRDVAAHLNTQHA